MLRNYIVTIRQEQEWQGVVQAENADAALHAAHREARFEVVIDQQSLVKEIHVDDDGNEVEVDVTPAIKTDRMIQ